MFPYRSDRSYTIPLRQRQLLLTLFVSLPLFLHLPPETYHVPVVTGYTLSKHQYEHRSHNRNGISGDLFLRNVKLCATLEQPSIPPVIMELRPGQPTELPDSLSDAAVRAAEATKAFYDTTTGGSTGMTTRCRVDFDTSIGDETFTIMKQSTDFMQQYVSALSYAIVPNLLQQRQAELMAVIQAKAELQSLSSVTDNSTISNKEQREDELVQLIANNGRSTTGKLEPTEGESRAVVRVYFPDEGSAALARRDWTPVVPPCVQFASCNGIQPSSQKNDTVMIQLFFCPRASDSDAVETILARAEAVITAEAQQPSLLTVFVNPVLVDMGVTGFGLAGRRLRERLIDGLVGVYYLRTLPWGALTRQWPAAYTVWKEDSDSIGGYKLLANLNNRLPSNPEVEDIYDVADSSDERKASGGGILEQFGDFVNGMMRL
jgi:Domain of unknown function (DUF1995)